MSGAPRVVLADDEAGRRAAQRIAELALGLTADDLVLCLISGGGSALLTLPANGLTLADKRAIASAVLDAVAELRSSPTAG